jgi:hypothetical protein
MAIHITMMLKAPQPGGFLKMEGGIEGPNR